ncbi:disintegrin and metalloproteinase domain-containing protein 5 precursor [Cavia porcellus]|uniref:Disintegrin and metalloproteinase domain-containing protein 5 n=1 Tax=Cavia porcellus TaxID=10141 RepID=ADAM5_CAVPO|nr:disintegrin and metalloproteinase domain-containing protein 5 precursor [Cavia porcellus]Q60472.1 RecName: Full=Disintegrin and metalloproteinase domain-containing protein 5; Flags: Precursor [Cavia porcellus]AAA74918.1 ADAM 5 protein precursor [Cavia porcellus]
MFLVLVLLTGLGRLYAGNNPRKTFVQTTVPERISSVDTRRHLEHNVAYNITLKGKSYVVRLKKESFLSSGSVIYFYDNRGVQRSQPLLPEMDCSYSGYVAGFPHSRVVFATCLGLRGVIQFENVSYAIEPLEVLSGFTHMIYEENNDNTHVPLFGKNNSYARIHNLESQGRRSVHKTTVSKLSPRYIDMYIVVNKNLFDYLGSDIKTVTQKIIQVIGLVNAMFTQLKLHVLISSIEIWSRSNKVTNTRRPDDDLFRFSDWKRKHVSLKSHYVAYLLTFDKYPESIGATFPENICNEEYASGIAVYPAGLSLESFAVIIVQLLSLSAGVMYDTSDSCYCSTDVCTMTQEAVFASGLKDFSTCSMDNFKYFASQYGLTCLRNTSYDMPIYKQFPPRRRRICGNSIREEGEECDCGTLRNCTHKKCCDPMQCRMKKGAKCGTGPCCTVDCQFQKANVLCRKSVDKDCDFDEYCNGRSGDCVHDTYAQNGHFCDSGGAFCFNGRCRTHDRQCQALIGGDSRGAPFACYDEVNSRGDVYGNCGRHQCYIQHALCGKLVCTWPHKQLVSRVNLSVVYAHVRDDICVATTKTVRKIIRDLSLTTVLLPEDRDETFVEDGTICGPGQYCDKWFCKEVQFINNGSCNAEIHCQGRGICNNLDNCHCHKGFVPPECAPKKGQFGSLDDGHLVETTKTSGFRKINMRRGYVVLSTKRFQLIFYIGIPVIIIVAAILIKQNQLGKLFCRGEKEHMSSVSEDGSRSVTLSATESKFPADTEHSNKEEDAQ